MQFRCCEEMHEENNSFPLEVKMFLNISAKQHWHKEGVPNPPEVKTNLTELSALDSERTKA